jgi:hypothetical protein
VRLNLGPLNVCFSQLLSASLYLGLESSLQVCLLVGQHLLHALLIGLHFSLHLSLKVSYALGLICL